MVHRSTLSDIISALTDGEENDYLFSGHKAEYWQEEQNKILEIFANMCSIEVNGYSSKAALRNMFGDLYYAFWGIVK